MFTNTQVYRRLQKVLLCLSHSGTLATLDQLGENHDEDVLMRQCNLTNSLMVSPHVTKLGVVGTKSTSLSLSG